MNKTRGDHKGRPYTSSRMRTTMGARRPKRAPTLGTYNRCVVQEETKAEDESLRVSGPNAHGFTHTRLYLVIVWGIALAVLLPLLWNLLVEGLP